MAACSELVDELQGLGYLERQPDPSDRRAKLIFPTTKGRAVLDAAGEAVADLEQRWREQLHQGPSIERATPSTTSLEPSPTKASSPGADQQVGGGRMVHGCRFRAVSRCPRTPMMLRSSREGPPLKGWSSIREHRSRRSDFRSVGRVMASTPCRPELRAHQMGRGVPRSRGVIGRSVQTRSTYTVTPSRDGRATPQPLKEGRDGMTIVEATRTVTGGIDTHGEIHVAAALDEVGVLLGTESFRAELDGYSALLAWLTGFGTVAKVGIEGTGSMAPASPVTSLEQESRSSKSTARTARPADRVASPIHSTPLRLPGPSCRAGPTERPRAETARSRPSGSSSWPSAPSSSPD